MPIHQFTLILPSNLGCPRQFSGAGETIEAAMINGLTAIELPYVSGGNSYFCGQGSRREYEILVFDEQGETQIGWYVQRHPDQGGSYHGIAKVTYG